MSKGHKSITQELKDHFRNSRRAHYEYIDLVRKSQEMSRKIDAMGAPTLSFEILWLGLIKMPLTLAIELLSSHLGKGGRFVHMEEPEKRSEITAVREIFWFALANILEWVRFWLGMLLRWFNDEIGIAMWSAIILIITIAGYIIGAALLIGALYFLIFR